MRFNEAVQKVMRQRKERADARFEAVSSDIREDLRYALKWARKTLRDKEGAGHSFHLTWQEDGIVCSFAKPRWSADHSGSPHETGSEAIVMSVCEYLEGM